MSRFVVIILLGSWVQTFSQGGAAVITLVMPPPGGDGYTALQTGGAFPTGAASLYYNPALLPELGRATGSQLHVTHSGQDLLPDLDLNDLNQNFTGLSAVIPDHGNGYDVGLGFFRNHVNFGKNLTTEEDTGDAFVAGETVYGLGLGLRLGGPVSVGGTAKFYDSHLSRGARADGFAFDIGAVARHRFEPLALLKVRSMDVTPSAGISWLNLGSDVWYVEPNKSDPLPTTLRSSLGAELRLVDMVEASVGRDWERDTHRNASWDDPAVRTQGYSVSVLGFRKGKARLDDPSGERREIHRSRSFEVSLLEGHRIWRRLATLDFTSASERLDAGYPFGTATILGIPFRANPRFMIGDRRIDSRDNGLRDGQRSMRYWSLGI